MIYTYKKFSALLLLCIILDFAFVGGLNWGLSLQTTTVSAMPETVDVFKGNFTPNNRIFATVNQTVEIAFSIKPIEDVQDTTIQILLPGDLFELIEGDMEWKGDVRKGEEVQLSLSLKMIEKMEGYVGAHVQAFINECMLQRSYYLLISTDKNETVALTSLSQSNVTISQTTSKSPAGYITVRGYFEYINEWGGYTPMRYATVILYDDDSWRGVPYDEKARSFTDANGYYSFYVENDDGLGEDGLDVFVVVYSETGAAITKTGAGDVYGWKTIKYDDVPDGSLIDYGRLHPTQYNEALQAMDAVVSEYQWIDSRVGWTRSQILIKWPEGSWPSYWYTYDPVTGAITADGIDLPDKATAGWDHVTVHHEYGHAVMTAAYGWNRNNLPSGWGPSPHYVFSESSLGFAVLEGWAEFMQCVVNNDPSNLADWYHEHGGNIETNDWYDCIDTGDMDGDIIEGSIASILWDIWDPANDDGLSLGFDEIWYIMSNNRPKSIHEFWNYWIPRYDYAQQMWAIYYNYGINKDTTPPSNPTSYSSSHTVDVWSSDNTIDITWFGASDDLSGVYGYSYVWNEGSHTLPDTTVDTTGTSATSPPLSDGKWYWCCRTRDNVGNWNPGYVYVGPFCIDTAPPSGSISINAGATYTTSVSVTLTSTYADATSGVQQVRYSNDGVWDTETWESPSPTKSWTLTPGDGTKTVYVQFKDNADLISPPYSDTITLDTATPITTIEHSPGSSILSLSAYDETSGVAVTFYRIDGGAWNTYTGPITLTGAGSHTIDYYSEDNAGNPEPAKSLTVHYLTVSTDPAGITSISGEGWYDAGTTATAGTAPSIVSGGTGEQYIFIEWRVDGTPVSGNPINVFMDSPHTATATYKTQYQISFTTSGLPDGVEVTVTVNGVDHPITTPSSYQEWFDEDTSVSFDINPKSLTVGGIEYTFDRWIRESDGQTITSPQTVTEPDKFKAIYKPVTYDVTIKAYCTTEGTDVSVSFTWDGTTYATSKIFTDQTGSHIVVVAEGDSNGHPFVKWVKDDTDYSTNREITVSSGGLYTAIYAAVPTNNPPTIPTVISPNGGEIWSGTHDITWTTSTDPDDDPITYEIEYSYDGGNTWHDLASGISGTSYPWDTTTCPDSANYLIRVRAYDGELYSDDWDASDSVFTIENRAPTIIDHAPTGTQVPVTTIISVTFSEAMNQTSSENAFSISPMVSGSFTWSDDTMTFTPSLGLEYDTTYDVTITTEAEDLVSNNLQSPFNWQFKTSVAPPPPSPPPAGPSPPPRIDVNVQTRDWEGEVLSNAYVEIVGRATSGLSDSNGWVNFTDIEAGTLTFDVYWMGAKVNKTTTTLKVDSTITLRCHVWNLQLLTQDVNNNSLVSTTIYTTFPNGTTKPLSPSTYRVMNGTYWFSVKWQNNWVYGNSSINLNVTTTSYTINCKVYQLLLSWRDHDGTWPFNPTSYKIIAPNGTISSVTTPIINQAQNGTWEIHAVYWQENNVVPSTHPTHELASNYNWTIHSRIYQIAIGFKDADGNVISTPSTYTITFPNQTSKSLGTFAFRCQNGTILITAITWQASEVCPSPNPTISITASQTYYVNLEVFNPTLNVLKPDGTTAFANTKLDIRFPNGTIIKNIQTDVNGQIILKVQKGTCYINVTTTDGYLAQVNHEVSISTTQTFDIPTIGLYAEVPVNEQIYPMLIKTNSTEVSNFVFDVEKREINFNVSGIPGTVGTCIINILKELVDSRSDIKVYIDGKKTEFTLTEDANNYYIYVEYQHSTRVIKISFAHSILEALLQVIIESGWLILLATVIVAVVALFSIFTRKKRISKIKQ